MSDIDWAKFFRQDDGGVEEHGDVERIRYAVASRYLMGYFFWGGGGGGVN